MAYRIGKDVTFQQMYKDIYRFMREMTSISEIDYQSSKGNGELFELSVPAATATTETWTLTCLDDTYPARFSVLGNVSGTSAEAYVEQYYDNGIIKFTLKDGSQPWVIGDIVTFSTQTVTSPAWTPRTINPEKGVEEAPMVVKGFNQKRQQFGSDTIAPTRGEFMYLEGPKEGSWGCRPTKKARWSDVYNDMHSTYESNYTYVGGHSRVNSIGAGDPYTPQKFTVQCWVKNVFTAKQSAGIDTGGEFLSSVYSTSTGHSTLSVGIFNGELYAGIRYGNIYYAMHYLWIQSVDITSYLTICGKSVDDWFMITIGIDPGSGVVTFWVDEELIGEVSSPNLVYTLPVLGGICSFADIADIVIWNKILTQSEVSDVYNNPVAVDPEAPEIYDSFYWGSDTCLPLIDMENVDNQGNTITVQMYPQNHPYYSYRYDMLHQSSIIKHNTPPEIQHMNSMYYHKDKNQWYNKGVYAPAYTLGGSPENVIISKYWVVVTNEYVACVYKIFDQNSSQQLPVYQTFYIGRGESLQDKIYDVCVGTRNTKQDFWYTNNSNFYSGLINRLNAYWYGQWFWQKPTRVGLPSKRAVYVESSNSFNVWSIFHASEPYYDVAPGQTEAYRILTWGYDVSYSNGLFAKEYMGTFKGFYGIQSLGTTPEDIVVIEGVEHLAYTDCVQAGQDSMLLLRLE